MEVEIHNLSKILILAYIHNDGLSTTPNTHLEFRYHRELGHELVVRLCFSLFPLVRLHTCLLFLSSPLMHGPLCIFSDSSCYSSHHTLTVRPTRPSLLS